jgi:uncharacterized protein YukE
LFLLKLGDIAKKLADIQTKMSSPEDLKRKQDDFIGNLTKQQTPLIDEIKRLTPILDKLKQQQQKDSENFNRDFEKSFQPITQKLNDLTKQQDLLKNIDSKLNQLSQNIDKENDFKKRKLSFKKNSFLIYCLQRILVKKFLLVLNQFNKLLRIYQNNNNH